MSEINIRNAVEDDLPAINDIFNHYVSTSTCVWTTCLCSEENRKDWFIKHRSSLPVLVAEYDDTLVGWGALSWFDTACTSSKTVENSVYVHHNFQRQGVGRKILEELVLLAKEAGLVSIIASISSDQAASIALHVSAGFAEAGNLKRVGYKFGEYHDLSYYQLLL